VVSSLQASTSTNSMSSEVSGSSSTRLIVTFVTSELNSSAP
jgi:hypothetical protein